MQNSAKKLKSSMNKQTGETNITRIFSKRAKAREWISPRIIDSRWLSEILQAKRSAA